MNNSALPPGTRGAGILLHVSSLPSRWGIGDFGPTALAWVDHLADAGVGWWQFLPLGPPGRGNSPYEPFSTFAVNELFLSPDGLVESGLLRASEISAPAFDVASVEFERVGEFKFELLSRAYNRFRTDSNNDLRDEFDAFCASQAHWLDDYALFRALRDQHHYADYREWPVELRRREPQALAAAQHDLASSIDRFRFAQFVLRRQGRRVRDYAHARNVRLIGDVPFLVAPNSAEVWSHPEIFLLDADSRSTFVAGVPPDYFSADGQLWGNPLYDWAALRNEGYAWWIDRIRAAIAQVDMVRLDHFRGFAAAWHIPAGSTTARVGEWRPGGGADFFNRATQELGPLPVIAEDLGLITADVTALRDQFHYPGMRVLQFAFDGKPENPFLPENYPTHVVAYTATHDNNTTRGWYDALPEAEREHVRAYLGRPITDAGEVAWDLIRLAWESRAALAVVPLQDVLNLGAGDRMNTPGQALGNWGWRATDEQVSKEALRQLAELTRKTGRSIAVPPAAN
jgi:4-alpha-glucanotransferase